ncbi:hypothetical protein H7F51_14000 [Novosphingobium flavum]|uniref:HTH luxR-type domain-containing protein n=1 Tax=Novosphingobium flavum TaxID=1778672 RepID=A0A7X1FUG3_9SPHN|nr:hypothetical protein [Novosphingobium flavum]MBC2666632.1 hypothetical protein [Novosphingobium flavum]
MALSTFDHNDLVLTLFEGLFAPAPWDTFLHRLLARTRAQRIVLIPAPAALAQRVTVRGQGNQGVAERAALAALAERGLRTNRVYALEELLDFDDPARRARQGGLLAAAQIGDARLIRVSGTEHQSVEIALLHERTVFGAAESALLTALVPAVAIAAANLAAITLQALQLTAAEDALALLGIGQAVLDPQGQVVTSDPAWQAHHPAPAALAEAARVAAADQVRTPLRTEDGSRTVLVRPLPPGRSGAAAIAALRTPRRADPLAAARVIAVELGLSEREAGLAALLAAGRPLVEAGRELRLTPETARNYSKRIYAKTGAKGQADLVRIVLEGLSGLA